MTVDKKLSTEDIRVITRIPGAHSELLADLLALPARDRPERLRLLASIGLAFSTKRRGDAVGDKPPVSKAVQDERAAARRAAFSLLANSIGVGALGFSAASSGVDAGDRRRGASAPT